MTYDDIYAWLYESVKLRRKHTGFVYDVGSRPDARCSVTNPATGRVGGFVVDRRGWGFLTDDSAQIALLHHHLRTAEAKAGAALIEPGTNDAERLAILEDAMRKLQGLVQQVARPVPTISAKLFELDVIGIVDSPEVNKAMGIEAPADDFEAVERILGKPLVVEFPDEPTSSEDEEPFDPKKGWEDR